MHAYNDFIAGVLDQSASAYAGYAATRLLETYPDLETRFAPDAFGNWRSNLTRRVQDLAVAIELDSPSVFASTVEWSRHAFDARELPAEDLQHSLISLQEVLTEELPKPPSPRLGRCFDAAFACLGQAHVELQALNSKNPGDRLALSYLQACLEGDARRATQVILDAVDEGLPVRDAYLHILVRAQVEVGRLWHTGKVAIHEEHFVTSTSERVMTLLAHRLPMAAPNGRTVIGATLHGNAHELGIRVLMDLFGAAGWKSIGLGTSLPAGELARAMGTYEADLLVVSVTMVSQLKALRETITAVRRAAPGIKILVGGLAFEAAPNAWTWAGADGYARSIEEALDMAQRLTTSS